MLRRKFSSGRARWASRLGGATVGAMVVAACAHAGAGNASTPATRPTAEATGSGDPLHAALVVAHRQAVQTCFGGFGKGAPYAVDMTVSGGAVSDAAVEPIAQGYGEPPRDCIGKRFRALAVPAGQGDGHVRARFAVKNPSCDLPTCAESDLPCRAKRDIDCSVVIDAR